MNRRSFFGLGAAALASLAIPLPAAFLAQEQGKLLDGWVVLARPCRIPGLEITRTMLAEMVVTFMKPIPVTVDFHPESYGWVTEVKMVGDELHARLELPSFTRAALNEYKAIVPAFVHRPGTSYIEKPKLVMAALTNTPAVPGTEL